MAKRDVRLAPDDVRHWFDLETIAELPVAVASFADAVDAASQYRRASPPNLAIAPGHRQGRLWGIFTHTPRRQPSAAQCRFGPFIRSRWDRLIRSNPGVYRRRLKSNRSAISSNSAATSRVRGNPHAARPAATMSPCRGRVGVWRGGGRPNISVAAPFVWRCLSGSTLAPFPHHAHRTGHADFPHPALGQDITPFTHDGPRPSCVRRTSRKYP
jgi:hypothetical protein